LTEIPVRTFALFTRSGNQCAVCSGWRGPCPKCRVDPIAVITEAQVSALLVGPDAASDYTTNERLWLATDRDRAKRAMEREMERVGVA
jgi:hypothetical protein